MISFIIPTRDRAAVLQGTLARLGRLPADQLGPAEIIIADNASTIPPILPAALANQIPVRSIRLPRNIGAAARNEAARTADPSSRWLVMLDDDSAPLDAGFVASLRDAPDRAAAVAAEILLPPDESGAVRHEAGGLPEVVIGCGAAIRTEVFRDLGGYDPAFDFYAEEYDLCARLIARGLGVVYDPRFRVLHAKSRVNRSFSRIIRRLVRNNAWVAQRYAPPPLRAAQVRATIARYARIARRERVVPAFALGLLQTFATLRRQRRTPLTPDQWDRFTGLHAARASLADAHAAAPLGRVALVEHGKHAELVAMALRELGVALTDDPCSADTIVPATLSPGPLLDAIAAAHRRWPGARVVPPFAEVCRARHDLAAPAAA
jgi:GT2 family glycosyltransferase